MSSFYVGDNDDIGYSDQKLTAFWHVNSFASSTCTEFGSLCDTIKLNRSIRMCMWSERDRDSDGKMR